MIVVPTGVQVGSLLTLRPHVWAPVPSEVIYQWFRNGQPIDGAESTSYVLVQEDRGASITVRAEATKANYLTSVLNSVAFNFPGASFASAPVPVIVGDPIVGNLLDVNVGVWDADAELLVEWLRDGVVVAADENGDYLLTAADRGKKISVRVTGVKLFHNTTVRVSVATAPVGSAFVSAPIPTISGSAVVGQVLSGVPGVWSPAATLKYQWLRNGSPIVGATAATYKLVAADVGASVSLKVTGSANTYATVDRFSEAKGPVLSPFTTVPSLVIVGTPAVGNFLQLKTPMNWLPTPDRVSYQWFRNSVEIPDAILSSYKLIPEDAGAKIWVKATSRKTHYLTVEISSTAPVQIAGEAFVSSPVPTILGSPIVSDTLSVSTGSWDPGTDFEINWFRDGQLIVSARDEYQVTESDRGKRISVSVTGHKMFFNSTTKTSLPTALVGARFNSVPIPTISGTPAVGSILGIATGTWSPSATLKFQWLRNSTPVTGATQPTYTLTVADFESKMSVAITGSAVGFVETTVTSLETAAVEVGPFKSVGTPTVTGSMRRGNYLAVNIGTWNPVATSVLYQWNRNGSPIVGQTNSTYFLGDQDAGQAISVTLTISARGYREVVVTSNPRTDWAWITSSIRYSASSNFASCIASDYSWQNFGGTYSPCDSTGVGVRLYDPSYSSPNFMIIRDYFDLPASTRRWKLSFERQSTYDYFYFMSTDSSVSNPSNVVQFTMRGSYSPGTFETPWIYQISNSRANYVITGDSDYGWGGFLYFDYIVLTYEAIG